MFLYVYTRFGHKTINMRMQFTLIQLQLTYYTFTYRIYGKSGYL